MNLNELINNLGDLSTEQLRILNGTVIDLIKERRNFEAAIKRRTLSEGDKVSFNGRRGYTEGTIVRVKRKKAIVRTAAGNWDVPLNMLTTKEV